MKIKTIKKIILDSPQQFYDVIEANPYNNFLIKVNSGYIVSHNCNLTDEVNFGIGNNVEKQKAKQRKMISQIDARMRSRFLRGTYLPTLNIIISSKDTEQAFLDSYINLKRQNESSTTLIVDEPQWVVDSRKGSPSDPGAFYVAVGNKFLAHELLPVSFPETEIDKYREKGYQMLKVPPGYREVFEDNLDQALMDIAGLSSSSATKYISGVRLNQAKIDTYRNPFTKDIIEVGNAPDDYLQYANFFDLSAINPNDLARPLFIHLDMSISGDKTGIAGVWITGKRPSIEGEDSSRELQYKLAFSVSVKAPKGYQVSFEKNRNFIRWLRDKGFSIKGISCFSGDTLISTPTGDKKIKDILPGDQVYAYDDNLKEKVISTVYNVINNGPRTEFIKVWIDNDTFIECTPEHPIKTARGYVMAKDILETDLIVVDDFIYYKQKLLATGYLLNNEFLDQYVSLIINNKNADRSALSYFEKHHIIPKAIYRLNKMHVNNDENNLCILSYNDHMLAHCLLTKCSIEPFKSKAISAIAMMMSHERLLDKITADEYVNNFSLQELIKNCKSGRKHTKEEILKISISNKKPHNVHPKSKFKPGHVPANKGISYIELFTDEERQEKFGHKQKYIWITDNTEERLLLEEHPIPDGFRRGRLGLTQETKDKLSKKAKSTGIKPPVLSGFKYYTNGIDTIKIFGNKKIPAGYHLGRTMNTDKTKEKNFLKSKTFKKINITEYSLYYKDHTVAETVEYFKISRANHKKLCKFYNLKKGDIK